MYGIPWKYPPTEHQARLIEQARLDRRNRLLQRHEMYRNGATPARVKRVHCVETDAIEIPDWARRHALEHFTREPKLIWVKQRNVANVIADEDRRHGGTPRQTHHQAYQCPTCKRWSLGVQAEQLARQVAHQRLAVATSCTVEPVSCGIHCEHIAA